MLPTSFPKVNDPILLPLLLFVVAVGRQDYMQCSEGYVSQGLFRGMVEEKSCLTCKTEMHCDSTHWAGNRIETIDKLQVRCPEAEKMSGTPSAAARMHRETRPTIWLL
jgi:hypothetical protein